MSKMTETPRYEVFSLRLTEDERKVVMRLTTEEARAALTEAGKRVMEEGVSA